MPKTKFQNVVFTIIMAAIMVYGMIVYNVALNTGGVTNATFGMALHEMPIMVPIAFILEFFVVEKLAPDLENTNHQDALIMIDVDDFKHVNDSYGHPAGDMVLVCISNIMESICRRHKVVRWGGEEFLVILMAVTEQEAFQICEEIRTEVGQFPFLHENKPFFCTITLGLTQYDKSLNFWENIRCADRALYRGKNAGKNQTVIYGEDRKTGV